MTETWLQFCGFTRTEVLGNTMKIVQGMLGDVFCEFECGVNDALSSRA